MRKNCPSQFIQHISLFPPSVPEDLALCKNIYISYLTSGLMFVTNTVNAWLSVGVETLNECFEDIHKQ
jgi:hypothetical protein